jgi:hypothetical protein
MTRKIETIFEHTSNGGSIGRLGIDEHCKLYWNEKPVLTKQEVKLQLWVNVALIVGAVSTLLIAFFAGLDFFGVNFTIPKP